MVRAFLLAAAISASFATANVGTLSALTPAGWMHPSCVHRVPHGAGVAHRDGGGFYIEHESLLGGFAIISPCNASVTLPSRAVAAPSKSVASQPFKGGWQVYAKQ